LFAEYPNLHVDTTVGGILKLEDDFYPPDKDYMRKIFIKHGDRILYGTDTFWGKGNTIAHNVELSRQHMRFITKLDLPQETLDLVCFKNSQRLFSREK
jgi:predicted TIM-barrel fold metal-dependent hydrolase